MTANKMLFRLSPRRDVTVKGFHQDAHLLIAAALQKDWCWWASRVLACEDAPNTDTNPQTLAKLNS